MDSATVLNAELSVEVFAAKDSGGRLTSLMMSVPCQCGLKEADTLRIDGFVMLAMRGVAVLSVDLPALSVESRADFLAWADAGQRLTVGEFKASGMLDSYFLNLTFVGVDRV